MAALRVFSLRASASFAFAVSLAVPLSAAADDAGTTDAGALDASGDAQVPDASAGDETRERCLDGYDRDYIEACAGKQAGQTCTFPNGSEGQCARLRCIDAEGAPLHTCVTNTSNAPPPFDVGEQDEPAAPEDAAGLGGGNGCGVSRVADGSGWLTLLAALWLCKRGRRSSN